MQLLVATNIFATPLPATPPTRPQVLHEYLEDGTVVIDNETAVKLGCLELRRFYKDMPQIALKRKENFTMLE